MILALLVALVAADGMILAPAANSVIRFNRDGSLVEPLTVRWNSSSDKASDETIVSIGQSGLVIGVLDLAILSPNQTTNGGTLTTQTVNRFQVGAPTDRNASLWQLLTESAQVLRVRIKCGLLSGCIVQDEKIVRRETRALRRRRRAEPTTRRATGFADQISAERRLRLGGGLRRVRTRIVGRLLHEFGFVNLFFCRRVSVRLMCNSQSGVTMSFFAAKPEEPICVCKSGLFSFFVVFFFVRVVVFFFVRRRLLRSSSSSSSESCLVCRAFAMRSEFELINGKCIAKGSPTAAPNAPTTNNTASSSNIGTGTTNAAQSLLVSWNAAAVFLFVALNV
jgi:hypothetical protein